MNDIIGIMGVWGFAGLVFGLGCCSVLPCAVCVWMRNRRLRKKRKEEEYQAAVREEREAQMFEGAQPVASLRDAEAFYRDSEACSSVTVRDSTARAGVGGFGGLAMPASAGMGALDESPEATRRRPHRPSEIDFSLVFDPASASARGAPPPPSAAPPPPTGAPPPLPGGPPPLPPSDNPYNMPPPPPGAGPSGPGPSDAGQWQEVRDADGSVYYHNQATGEVSWTAPEVTATVSTHWIGQSAFV